MRDRSKALVVAAAVLFACALLSACSIQTDKGDEKKGSKVDIQLPAASLHVATNEQAKAAETGLPVYPGARPAPADEHDSQAANVNLGFAGFGLKVIAVKYVSDDPPDKLREFYRKALSKYGKVVDCKGDLDINAGKDDSKMTCAPSHDEKVEMGVGDGSIRHVVSLKPKDKGTEFGLVYIQTRGGKEHETM